MLDLNVTKGETTMDDYIKREDALLALCSTVHLGEEVPCRNQIVSCQWNATRVQDYAESILAIPSADVAPVQRWIPVTERLPEENGLYFCCWKAQCDDKSWIIRLADWRADTGWMNMYDEPMKKPITHWMPLPNPPKGETNGTT